MTHTSSISSESLLPCSVVIGSHGRREHLLRQLNSILASNELPSELVLVTDDVEHCELTLLKELGIAIQLLPVQWASDETKRFDIGRQREFGASNANEDWLIFLDVDCLVSPTFLGDILSGLQQTKRQTQTVLMGEPYYLPADSEINSWFNNHATNKADHLQQLAKKVLPKAQQQWQQAVTDLAISHPRRPAVTEFVMPTDDYASFWSLCFALHRLAYDTIGGFDASYTGYGAEDTDFAFTAKEQGIDFYLSQARAYHQQHTVYRPPLNHLSSIVANANRFYEKWGKWAMGGWLRQFSEMGLIDWTDKQTKPIQVLREPSEAELEQAHAPNARFV